MTSRATGVLFILLAATGLTAITAWPGSNIAPLYISIVTIGIAAFKIRMIAFEFMEVGTAPLILRVFVMGWLAIVTAALITLYNFGQSISLQG
ncbi:cytochrome C oxidase subunit IV family protein [Rhizorhabdus argentea]|uniref:cytochrome C oxidase subunit IV family protein n=1 Tax=Rhizorhabdus argentea TaxID=1387174 RepID=UPI003BF5725B